VHGEGAEVLFYREFAALLGADQPVYGLQARGLDGTSPPHASIEAMATDYLSEIQTVQPKGPYFLGGHCFGAVIAFEMAQQLCARGERVAFLGFMDGSAPPAPKSLRDYAVRSIDAVRRDPIGFITYVIAREVRARRRWRWRPNGSRASGPEERGGAGPREEVIASIANAYRKYVPRRYPGRIDAFVNAQRALLKHDRWSALAADGVSLHVFPGTYRTTFREPSLPVLAAKFKARLTELSNA
jgi:thioesterase domain-containing protein